ncbi:hypothetical protein PsorP6_015574 [Peronosclerospora sorghi]|uniref:Uncharacterized protein n=1 Tax=Peronosclerospora sorghi TaxID=230839 RepID=A0ACC0WNF0_9STRA|nr:hypothetical protein PsorP6_015574 [Peronosclerospora sorghi]
MSGTRQFDVLHQHYHPDQGPSSHDLCQNGYLIRTTSPNDPKVASISSLATKPPTVFMIFCKTGTQRGYSCSDGRGTN